MAVSRQNVDSNSAPITRLTSLSTNSMAPSAAQPDATIPATVALSAQFMVCSKPNCVLCNVANKKTHQGRLKPARIFKNAVEPTPPPSPSANTSRVQNGSPRQITGISFDDRGDQLITAGEDETFRLYSCKTGKRVHPFSDCLPIH